MRGYRNILLLIFAIFSLLFWEFGSEFTNLFNVKAFALVGLGVMVTMLLAGFDFYEFVSVFKECKNVESISDRVSFLLYVNEQVRQKGFKVCERLVNSINDPFLKKGLRLIADNPGPEFAFGEALVCELDKIRLRNEKFLNLIMFAANASPGIGLIGTLLGLSLNSNPSALNHAIMTTLYGAILSNFVFLPAHEFFKEKLKKLEQVNLATYTGLIKIRDGLHSVLLAEHLSGYEHSSNF
ncbi:MAG: MotA/TolQ/ExbB proton channel family protein [Deltaproteobacteria bacterium]|nr:MotA/TolQ/ExbB proton channel family protein [Deltaproteobacteria bacterium]